MVMVRVMVRIRVRVRVMVRGNCRSCRHSFNRLISRSPPLIRPAATFSPDLGGEGTLVVSSMVEGTDAGNRTVEFLIVAVTL